MKKIELKYDDYTSADELIDQIVLRELQFMVEFCIKHDVDHDVLKACQVLVEYMSEPHVQPNSD
jgi:hypothetical protein